jgi:hypothetical protein
MFKQREYKKKIIRASLALMESEFVAKYELSPYLEMLNPVPAPTEVRSSFPADCVLALHI